MKDMERLNISAGGQSGAWIGLISKPEFTRTWYWSLTGVEFNESETNWNSGEPSDTESQGSENCVYVYNSLKWVDTGCNLKRFFLCYDESNSQKYHLSEEMKTWQEAQSFCREKHTDLISGTKQLEDEEVKKLMKSSDQITYFGLFRDNWRWSDGSSFSFRHWNNELNNPESVRDLCAKIDDGGRWKNENCDERKPFICYDDKVILIKENKTWEEALYYCRDHHHDLVTITNMEDQRWIQEKVKNASTDYVWTGLRYTCTLDLWFWVSDEVVSYKNWAEGEPMDDCDMSGAMETRGGHQWRKKNDLEEFNFICSQN
ncbi:macrophage mannose receptor 1-like [Gambusia affinis]|uniref:macrophage mannose receptor 1-like n=1 Tax=Gambusia affinis TaxID=33528 RepID=UPI001CDC3E19|nr:macrophage mannose receptor 1-like [Gambusia affinis]